METGPRSGTGNRLNSRLRFHLKPWAFLLLLAAVIAAALFAIDRYRHRFVRTDAQMFTLLPRNGATRFYVNVAALRRAGVLNLLAASKREDPEYRNFVRQTGFDYQRDANAIAGTADSAELLFVVRGHFDWDRLRDYAKQEGGGCRGNLCSVPAAKAGRWASFVSVEPDVIGLAISADQSAARKLLPHGTSDSAGDLPSYPVWVELSQNLLKNPANLPFPVRILAIWLQSASRVVLSLGPAPEGAQAAFELRLEAAMPNAVAARTTRNQLEIETRMLKLELTREHRQPSADDLTGLLAAGTFEASGNELKGIWPVRKELLNTLQ